VIVASRNEGFGLPIIEAAQYGKPVIATDIPVFREVAGEGATYFPVDDAPALAALITRELAAPSALAPIGWLSWEQSAQSLLKVLREDNWLFFVDPV
jgi:glycosyltransferase involved in cell wall biosynthesis